MASHRPQQLLWGLGVFRLHMSWLRYSHLTNINQCQRRVGNGSHWSPLLWASRSMVSDLFLMINAGQCNNKLPSALINDMIRDLPVFKPGTRKRYLVMAKDLVAPKSSLVSPSAFEPRFQGRAVGCRDDKPDFTAYMKKVD